MDINQSILVRNLGNSLNSLKQLMDRAELEVSSGSRLVQPSDHPGAFTTYLDIRQLQSENRTMQKTVSTAQDWLQSTSTSLSQLLTVIHSAISLSIQGQDGTLTSSALSNLGLAANALVGEAAQVANQSYGQAYLFAGESDTKPPVVLVGQPPTSATYQGSSTPHSVDLGASGTLTTSLTGDQLFTSSSTGILPPLMALAQDLASGNTSHLATDQSQLQNSLNFVVGQAAVVGEGLDRLTTLSNSLQATSDLYDKIVSNAVSVDPAKVITQLLNLKTSYQEALQVGAQIIQPTLLSYLQ